MFLANLQTKITLLLIFSIFTFSTSFAATIYVDSDLTGGDGTTWATAYGDLSVALASANSGDEVWVKKGTYKPTTTTNRNIAFQVTSGVKLFGGFSGTETSASARNPLANITILSGDIGTINDFSDNSYTIVVTKDVSLNTQISGFTLQLGNADVGSGALKEQKSGGALFNEATSGSTSSSPQLDNLIFANNYAVELGGALFSEGNSGMTISNCTFKVNVSANEGGAIFISGNGVGRLSSPSIQNCTFDNNAAKFGGAIYSSANEGEINVAINSALFKDNRAVGSGSIGGATFTFAKSATGTSNISFVNCIFDSNESQSSAGGVYALASDGATGNTIITNCTFYANSANAGGGAVYQNESTGSNGQTTINNSIFDNHTVGFNPIFNMSGSGVSSPTLTVKNCIFDVDNCGDVIIIAPGETFNCDGTSLFNADGSVDFTNPTGGDFSLQSSSAALNKGDNSFTLTPVDYVSNPRIANTTVDIGALENQAPLPIELIHFSAKAASKSILLDWATASETNNNYFLIERSTDGRNFNTLKQIKGAGTTTNSRYYSTEDENPSVGRNYYRLQQVDFDGQYSYSPIRVIKMGSQQFEVYPNPVSETLFLRMSQLQQTMVNYEILTITGQLMMQGAVEADAGIITLELNQVANFKAGLYIVRVIGNEQAIYTQKFTKLK